MQYIGVDQHKKFSYIVVMDEKGRIVKEGKVVNDREELKKFLRGWREGRAKAVRQLSSQIRHFFRERLIRANLKKKIISLYQILYKILIH